MPEDSALLVATDGSALPSPEAHDLWWFQHAGWGVACAPSVGLSGVAPGLDRSSAVAERCALLVLATAAAQLGAPVCFHGQQTIGYRFPFSARHARQPIGRLFTPCFLQAPLCSGFLRMAAIPDGNHHLLQCLPGLPQNCALSVRLLTAQLVKPLRPSNMFWPLGRSRSCLHPKTLNPKL